MNDNDIKHLEELSKLKFSDQERQKFAAEFANVLNFVEQIAKLDLPEKNVFEEAISLSQLREDKAGESMSQEEILMNAPKQKDGCFLTPLVVD